MNYIIQDENEHCRVRKEATYIQHQDYRNSIQDQLQMPRMLSISQVEEVVYSLLHISALKEGVTLLKMNHENLHAHVETFEDKQRT